MDNASPWQPYSSTLDGDEPIWYVSADFARVDDHAYQWCWQHAKLPLPTDGRPDASPARVGQTVVARRGETQERARSRVRGVPHSIGAEIAQKRQIALRAAVSNKLAGRPLELTHHPTSRALGILSRQ